MLIALCVATEQEMVMVENEAQHLSNNEEAFIDEEAFFDDLLQYVDKDGNVL